MELLMWVAVSMLWIVINGTVSSKLDNEHSIINLENIFSFADEKATEDYQALKGKIIHFLFRYLVVVFLLLLLLRTFHLCAG